MLNLHHKINLPYIPNQPRQLKVLTIPDIALRLRAARLHWFYDATKPWLENVEDEM